ncbi:MAG TPA: ACP S-malonyltransferase [Burkholderiaceae bacterium]|nr:ACP S-malonyltransferase [Burkholderiaceae bacterium]
MKVAFVFPGQGSQSVGMLSSFAGHAVVEGVLDRASTALGQDLRRLIAEGPVEDLNLTVNTQPVMLVAAYAMYEAWRTAGGAVPAMVAGHSLGEYTALTAARVLELEDAVQLVRMRAGAMQDAVPVGTGAMAAIMGLADDEVRAACAEAAGGEVVQAVNFNAPSQVVIAGHKNAVERACAAAKQRGAKRALPLPVSAPFHSSLMQPAADRLRQYLARVPISAPAMPVVNNVDVEIEASRERIVDALSRQAASPVRWVETVQRLAREGVTHVVECGPGRVLSGLTKRIEPALESLSINDADSLVATLEGLAQGGRA